MSRFTYTTPDGSRVEVPDLDVLREHVAAGEVQDDTPFFDGSTGLEAPAHRHQAYRFVRDLELSDSREVEAPSTGSDAVEKEVSGADETAGEGREPRRGGLVRGDLGLSSIDVTLADEDAGVDPDEEVRRLLKERERDTERGVRKLRLNPYNETLRAWDGDPPWEEGPPSHAEEEEAEEAEEAEEGEHEAQGAQGEPGEEGGAPEKAEAEAVEDSAVEDRPVEDDKPAPVAAKEVPTEAPARAQAAAPLEVNPPEGALTDLDYPPTGSDRPRRTVPRPARRRRRSRRRGRFVVQAVLLLAIMGAGGYMVLTSGAATIPGSGGEGGDASGGAAMAEGPGTSLEGVDPSGVAGMLAASEANAFRDMVAGMDSLARAHDALQVPVAWLESEYLADADQYPGVRAFWERYAEFVSTLREEDRALFRRGYLDRLEGNGVSRSVATMRLAEAQRRFEETQPQRDAKYDRMEDLSRAAIELHDLLALRTDDLLHDPITPTSAPEEPALQVRTEDDQLRDRIWDLLDTIFNDLEEINGEARWTTEDMTPGVLEGIGATGEGPSEPR